MIMSEGAKTTVEEPKSKSPKKKAEKSKTKINKSMKSPEKLPKSQDDSTESPKIGKPSTPAKAKKAKISNPKNKVYIRYKKSMQDLGKTVQDLMTLHKDIVNVRLPRKGLKEKFFFAIFKTSKAAAAAVPEIKESQKCFVNICSKKGTDSADKKQLKEKNPKLGDKKKELTSLWT